MWTLCSLDRKEIENQILTFFRFLAYPVVRFANVATSNV